MVTQLNLRVHAGECQVGAVVFPQADIVECFIVIIHIFLPPLRIFEYPALESLLHLVLLFPCKHGFLFIDFIMVLAVPVVNPVPDSDGAQV